MITLSRKVLSIIPIGSLTKSIIEHNIPRKTENTTLNKINKIYPIRYLPTKALPLYTKEMRRLGIGEQVLINLLA